MAVVTTMQQFFRELAQVEDDTKRAVMRFQFELATKIAEQTQDNIKRVFGEKKDSKARSEITSMSRGRTARTQGRGGGLMRSVALTGEAGGKISVTVGGLGAPYAVIHEFGGRIRAKKRFLTIPLGPKYVGKRAREFDLVMDEDDDWGLVLRENTRRGKIAYLLRRSVNIPARPYFKPAVDSVTQGDSELRKMMIKLLGRNSFSIEVA